MELNDENISIYQQKLLAWWMAGNARQYPWRLWQNRTPYRALIAELMLRRTRADQVVPVYNQFLSNYPTLSDAVEAETDELSAILYPLGLQWRAGNIAALLAVAKGEGMTDIPVNVEALRSLPGVGDYVSNAVACFAGADENATLIDTNVVRVLGRIFNLDITGEARRRKSMIEAAVRTVDRTHEADYHYAILDFAALVCKARVPACSGCPFAKSKKCAYYLTLLSTG